MKKFLAWLLLLAMLLFCVPAAFADGDTSYEPNGSVTVIDPDSEGAEAVIEEVFEETEPFIPEEVERTIVGTDNRITVRNSWDYPFSAIAYIEAHASCGCSWSCSGFMVNKDRLLTAAHCLVCSKHGQWADRLDFYFGYNGRGYSYKYTGKWTAWSGNLFRSGTDDFAYDWGCVRLASDVGNTTGWFGTWWGMSDSQYTNTWAYVAGYADGKIRYDSGYVDSVSADNLYYTMDTVGGNSGGPVFDSDYYAIGIHVGTVSRGSSTLNVAHRLTSYVKSHLDDLTF